MKKKGIKRENVIHEEEEEKKKEEITKKSNVSSIFKVKKSLVKEIINEGIYKAYNVPVK